MKVEVYRKNLLYRVKLVAKNGETVLVSETYFSHGNANRAAKRIKEELK